MVGGWCSIYTVNLIHETASRTATLDTILELVALLGDDSTRSLARQGLTRSRAHLLWLLHHGGPATQRSLAEALKVTPRNVTGLVDALAATGFVTREPHPTDRRATLVSLTSLGTTTMAEMTRDHRKLAELLFDDIPGPRFRVFADELDQVVSRLRDAVQADLAGSP